MQHCTHPSPADGHLGHFQFGATMNNAAIANSWRRAYKVSCRYIFPSIGCTHRSGIAGSRDDCVQPFDELPGYIQWGCFSITQVKHGHHLSWPKDCATAGWRSGIRALATRGAALGYLPCIAKAALQAAEPCPQPRSFFLLTHHLLPNNLLFLK